MLHGTKTISFATMVARSLATNFGIGEALRDFGLVSKTRNANNGSHVIFLFHRQNARGLRTKINIAGSVRKLTRVTCQRELTTVAHKIVFKNRSV